MAKADIRVRLRSEQPAYAYGEVLRLTCTIENRSNAPRFVVSDPLLLEPKGNGELQILLGENPIPAGLYYFDYEPPSLQRLAPGATRTSGLTIAMPLLDTEPDGEEVEIELSGVVQLSLRVAFLKAPFRSKSANPWGEFIVAQEISTAARTRVRIEPP